MDEYQTRSCIHKWDVHGKVCQKRHPVSEIFLSKA